jgi:hypothetical protein
MCMDELDTLHKWLAELKKERRLSWLARRIDVSHRTLCRIANAERGSINFRTYAVLKAEMLRQQQDGPLASQ